MEQKNILLQTTEQEIQNPKVQRHGTGQPLRNTGRNGTAAQVLGSSAITAARRGRHTPSIRCDEASGAPDPSRPCPHSAAPSPRPGRRHASPSATATMPCRSPGIRILGTARPPQSEPLHDDGSPSAASDATHAAAGACPSPRADLPTSAPPQHPALPAPHPVTTQHLSSSTRKKKLRKGPQSQIWTTTAPHSRRPPPHPTNGSAPRTPTRSMAGKQTH